MAFRTWGKLLLTALGVSVLAGAGQLGVAYGFGIVRLDGDFTAGSVNRWPAQLVWVGWFAALAAVAGAVLTERLARRVGFPGSSGERVAVAGAAALGATVVAPLCMQPARAAELGPVDPMWAVGICAVLGAVVGAGAALAVLLTPPLGWNVALTAGLVWLLALVSVVPSLASAGPLPTVRLGVVEPSWLDPATAQRLAMLFLPAAALLAGAVTGALARWRGHIPLVGGTAGAAGPVLVAFAYLTAGPGDAGDRYQLAPYYGALIAVAAGALGSTAATVLRRRSGAPATGAIEPTDILQPLPAGPVPTAVAARAADLPSHPAGAGRPAPAHWDWPVAPGGTPTPAPTGTVGSTTPSSGEQSFADHRAGTSNPTGGQHVLASGTSETSARDSADRTTGRARATAGAGEETITSTPGASVPGPVIERDPDDPAQSMTASTPLSSARRISAVDVLAAGRAPAPTAPGPGTWPEPSATPARVPTAAPGSGTPIPPRVDVPTAPTEVPTPATPSAGTGAPTSATGPDASTTPAEPGITGAPTAGPPASAAPVAPRAKPPKRPRRPRTGAPADPATSVPPPADPASADSPPAAPAAATPRATRRPARVRREPTPDPRTATAGQPTRTDPAEVPPAASPSGTELPSSDPEPAGTASPASNRPSAAAPAGTARRATAARPDTSASPSDSRDEAPATAPGPSPRPRFSLFDDDTDRRGDVRPTRPITPAPAPPWPDTGPADDGPADTAPPAEPAPRPRHRALSDLEQPPRRDALDNTTPHPSAPGSDEPETEAGTGHPGRGSRARHADDPETTDEVAGGPGDDADGEKARPRRGLFRRNRAKGGEESAGGEPEPVPAHDAEYVDWVTGLGRPTESESDRSLRTGRHHRD